MFSLISFFFVCVSSSFRRCSHFPCDFHCDCDRVSFVAGVNLCRHWIKSVENCRHLREELVSFNFALIVVELTTKGKVMTFLCFCYRPLSHQSDVIFFLLFIQSGKSLKCSILLFYSQDDVNESLISVSWPFRMWLHLHIHYLIRNLLLSIVFTVTNVKHCVHPTQFTMAATVYGVFSSRCQMWKW